MTLEGKQKAVFDLQFASQNVEVINLIQISINSV